jgi:hypothetical protein
MDIRCRFERRQNRIRIASHRRQHRKAVPRQRFINGLVAIVTDRARSVATGAVTTAHTSKRASNEQQAGKCQRHDGMPNMVVCGHHFYYWFKHEAQELQFSEDTGSRKARCSWWYRKVP